MKKSYDRIFAQLFNQPWLITEDWMGTIISIANREGDIEAIAAKHSSALPDTEGVSIRDGVAIVNVSGPIFPKATLFTKISGATAISTLATDLTAAVENDEVESIVLNVDSPGGNITGINEMANMIRQYSAIKPIYGYSGGVAASAGYWLLSACSSITIDATARLGSIGVVAAFASEDKESKDIEIVNTASPKKRVDHTTEEGKAVVVEGLDALAEVFISSVADFRGTTSAVVKKDFGRGGILIGSDAVNAGMADSIGSFEGLLKEKTKGGTLMDKYDGTVASLKEHYPAVYESVYNEGKASSAKDVETKDEEIVALKSSLDGVTASNTELMSTVSAFKKQDAIREEQAITTTSSVIVSDKLAASSIPARLHSKVKALISHEAFVIDGKLNVAAFSASVDEEISSWEDTASAVGGIGTNTDMKADSTEKTADDMVAHLVSIS